MQHNRNRSGFLKLAAAASMLLWASIAATSAKADIVSVHFVGDILAIDASLASPTSPFGNEVGAFQSTLGHAITFSGFYTFNSANGSSTGSSTGPLSSYSNTITHFEFALHRAGVPNAILSQSISEIDYRYTSGLDPLTSPNTISVGNNDAATPATPSTVTPGTVAFYGGLMPPSLDSYEVNTSLPTGIVTLPPASGAPGWIPHLFDYNYIHNNFAPTSLHPQGGPFVDSSLLGSTSILTHPSLVSSPPGLNWLQDGHAASGGSQFRVEFSTAGLNPVLIGSVHGTITNLVANPLPPAVMMFGAGLVALIGLGARNWRQKRDGLV